MSGFKIKSHAKINLCLNITGKNSRLHKIETIVAFVDLHDEIKVKIINSDKHIISFNGKFSAGINNRSTVYNLLKILEKKRILKGVKFRIRINKKIPNKAGLGGGSMNAASFLKFLLDERFIILNKKEILSISRKIGSDVPLGLNPINSILTSNNIIERFKKCKKFYTLIVKPNFGCSTKEIYTKVRKFNKPLIKRPRKELFNLDNLKKMNNNLENIAFTKYPRLKLIKFYLETLKGKVFVRMTGSGSALVAYFYSKKNCLSAKKKFKKKYKNYWCIASKTI